MKSGDLLEVAILDTSHTERRNIICEVIGQGVDGLIHKSIVYEAVLAASEDDLMSWAVPNL